MINKSLLALLNPGSSGEGNGKSTPVLLPEKSHGQRCLVGYSPWGRKESDTTERLYSLTVFYDFPLGEILH